MKGKISKRKLWANTGVWATFFAAAILFFNSGHRWINALFLAGMPPLIWWAVTTLDKLDLFYIWVAIGRHVRRHNVRTKGPENETAGADVQEGESEKKERRVAWESLLIGGGSVFLACVASIFSPKA